MNFDYLPESIRMNTAVVVGSSSVVYSSRWLLTRARIRTQAHSVEYTECI